MAKKSTAAIEEEKLALAKELVYLMTPRLMEEFTAKLDANIENLEAVKALAIKDADTKTAEELLVKLKAQMDKILSGRPADALSKFYIEEIVKFSTLQQLEIAVAYEKFHIGLNGLTPRAEVVLQEALGEV